MSDDKEIFTKQYEEVFDQIKDQIQENEDYLLGNIEEFHAKCHEKLAKCLK